MFKLIDPEVWHVIFAVGGAVIGWWLRHRQGNGGVPADVAAMLEALLEKRKQQQTQSQLDELLTSVQKQKGQEKP